MVPQSLGLPKVPSKELVVNKTHRVKVYNLSSVSLPEGAISLAALGPKFVPLTYSDPDQTKIDILNFSRLLLLRARFFGSTYEDESLITPVSNYIPKSTKFESLKSIITDLEIFANEVSDLKRTHVNDNLTVSQRNGLKFLKENKDLLYFKADKGSGVVFLDPDMYNNLVMCKLNSPNFEKLHRNTDYFTMVKLNSLVRRHTQMLTTNEKRAITRFDYKSTNIYAVPKIHKSQLIKDAIKNCHDVCLTLTRPSDLTVRVIFGGPKNVTTGIANLVDVLLKPFVGLIQARVRDAVDFVNKIPRYDPAVLPRIQMWSVDVQDMYQNIEHGLGLEAVEYWLDRYPEKIPARFNKKFILESLLFVLENNTGYFNGNFYRQIRGTATGIKPAPIYADLTMGYLEIKFFYQLKMIISNEVASFFWNNYRRYLDDGQIMWDTQLGDFTVILNLMNQLHPSIKFTSVCDNFKLVYLNVTILKTNKGFLTEIYNKETDSDTYLPFASSHPHHCKVAIPFELARSVRTLTDKNETVEKKLKTLGERLQRCGYPQGVVVTACQKARFLNIDDLRKTKEKNIVNNEIPFVHQYDPSLPQLFPTIKELTSRLFSCRELKPIFGETRIINSQREPPSLGRMLQHSKFEENSIASNDSGIGVTKCGMRGCGCCADILEVSSFYFANSGINFEIKTPMNCTARNIIYVLQCKACYQTYIGETVNFRDRMSAHKTSSKDWDTAMEVGYHLNRCGKGFWRLPIFKVKVENKIARLVYEHKLIKMLKPDLNRDTRNLLHLSIGTGEQ